VRRRTYDHRLACSSPLISNTDGTGIVSYDCRTEGLMALDSRWELSASLTNRGPGRGTVSRGRAPYSA